MSNKSIDKLVEDAMRLERNVTNKLAEASEIDRLKAVNAELLEFAHKVADYFREHGGPGWALGVMAERIIARAEGR